MPQGGLRKWSGRRACQVEPEKLEVTLEKKNGSVLRESRFLGATEACAPVIVGLTRRWTADVALDEVVHCNEGREEVTEILSRHFFYVLYEIAHIFTP